MHTTRSSPQRGLTLKKERGAGQCPKMLFTPGAQEKHASTQRAQHWAVLSLVVAATSLTPLAVFANQEPAGLNLGLTSFFDGFGPPKEGFTYQAYLSFANTSSIYDGHGNKVDAFRDPRISTFVWVNQLSYFLPQTWFGDAVRPGINFVLPTVLFDTSFRVPGPVLSDNGIGLGDLTFGPSFQFSPIMVDDHPVFSHRFEVDLTVPTGRYDPTKNLNQSSNYVSINPYWAATIMLAKGLELSVRLHYLFNARNDRPTNLPFGVMAQSAQAGQAAWANFAASYEILETLHIGVSGYYFRQLTVNKYHLADGTWTDSDRTGEGKEQVLGIGPGLLWDPARAQNMLFANVYFQTLVQNRASAMVFSLRWLHSFEMCAHDARCQQVSQKAGFIHEKALSDVGRTGNGYAPCSLWRRPG